MSAGIPDATELRDAIAAGELGATEAVERAIARISSRDGAVRALSFVDAEGARRRAAELDREGPAGRALFGLPVVVKGNLCVAGLETNCGSRILAGYRPPYTATCVSRLERAGAVVIGTGHMDEFAMGSSGENSAYATTRNPWDLERSPGGSSSGPAAAVASGMAPLALGSDTGGSVRQPAALCGISGFKPTYGRVSRLGLVAFGSSLDQVSPLARSARDLELVMTAIGAHDPGDATSIPAPDFEPAPAAVDLAGARIGVVREQLEEGVDPGVAGRIEEALELLRSLGARTVDVSLPHAALSIPTYYVVATAEASSNLARYDGVRYGRREDGDGTLAGMMAATRESFGPEVKRRILLGTFVLSRGYHERWYGRATQVRAHLRRELEEAFTRVDWIAGPTSPTPAFRIGERTADPLAMYRSDVLTVPASLAGLPAVSIPCGFAGDGGAPLPVGLQLVGPRLSDASLLRAARRFQEHTSFHRAAPPLAGEDVDRRPAGGDR